MKILETVFMHDGSVDEVHYELVSRILKIKVSLYNERTHNYDQYNVEFRDIVELILDGIFFINSTNSCGYEILSFDQENLNEDKVLIKMIFSTGFAKSDVLIKFVCSSSNIIIG